MKIRFLDDTEALVMDAKPSYGWESEEWEDGEEVEVLSAKQSDVASDMTDVVFLDNRTTVLVTEFIEIIDEPGTV